jgi:D-alanyl-D-alanine carboxypeptidase
MKQTTFMLLIIMILLLVACQDEGPDEAAVPEPTAAAQDTRAEGVSTEPTEEPEAPEPTVAPTEEPVAETDEVDLTALVVAPWQWITFTNPMEQFEVEMPENYSVTFNEDGTLNLMADCNNASGSYTVGDSSLTIAMGPSTMAACPEGSRGDQLVQLMTGAAIYFIEDDTLFIDLMADGGTMAFRPAMIAEQIPSEAEGVASGMLSEDIVGQLDAFLQSQVYTEGGNPELAAPGLVLLVDAPDGRYLKAAGVADMDDGTPIQVDDILQIGSNTKSMVIVLLMQLVEEGILNLDDTLGQWLPEQAAIVPNGDQITIRQMAMHTAGIHDYEEGIITQGLADPAKLQAGYTPAEIVQFAMDEGGPDFSPGEEGQWNYSNTGYILLGMLIEAATGESLGELLQARIFDPLALESAVLIEGVPREGEITTKGYKWTEEGERLDTTNWNGSQGWAAGSVAMTAEDLATYGQALAAGKFFQDPGTLTEMLTFNPDALSSGFPYAMGLVDFVGDGTVWGHAGATPGFQSLWYTDPEDGIMVVGLTNSGDYSGFAFLNVLNILEGNGAQPLGPYTMLPADQLIGTIWAWEKFITPMEMTDIDEAAEFAVIVSKDGSVTVTSAECGQSVGTYTSSGMGNIDFEIDGSSLTCDADSPAGQFVQYLNDATSWSFNNGSLLIELPADSGTMVFKYVNFG